MSYSWLGVFSAGILTFLSPCVLPMIPILIGNSIVSSNPTRRSRTIGALWFSLGFTVVFVLMGMSIPALSVALGSLKPWLLVIAGLFIGLFGLKLMGQFNGLSKVQWMNRTYSLPDFSKRLPKSLKGIVFGSLFGLSWTPCVGPILGGVLTYVASQKSTPSESALLLFLFAAGISLPMIATAYALESVLPLLKRLYKFLPRIEFATGVALLVFGIFILNQARFQTGSLSPSLPSSITFLSSNISDSLASNLPKNGLQSISSPSTPNAIQSSSKMFFFYSEHCPICHAMETFLPEFENSCSSEHFQVFNINVDQPENSQIARHFNIQAVPTIALLDPKGTELTHLVGYQTEGRLRNAARNFAPLSCLSGEPEVEKYKNSIPIQDGTTCSAGKSC